MHADHCEELGAVRMGITGPRLLSGYVFSEFAWISLEQEARALSGPAFPDFSSVSSSSLSALLSASLSTLSTRASPIRGFFL